MVNNLFPRKHGGLWAYLEKKSYKEAAKLLIKIGIGGNVIYNMYITILV
ncbi:hypothetical protein ABG775_11670 [Peribacillus simplex]